MTMSARERYVRDRCACVYCDISGVDNFDVRMNLSVDHIVPKGGESDENIAIACQGCNYVKGEYNRTEALARKELRMREIMSEQDAKSGADSSIGTWTRSRFQAETLPIPSCD